MNFGSLLKDIRIAKGLTLRQCCEQLGVDPSNWSKLERGLTPAPKDPAILENWASALGLSGAQRQEFIDTAALSRHELPADIASDNRVLAALPAFFRAARGSELNDAALKQFVEDVRALQSAGPKTNG
jgi:transcriptional regulator with XRE-family HTH domain